MIGLVKRLSLLLSTIIILFVGGCIENSQMKLFHAAETTYLNYIQAVNAGQEKSQPEIPAIYWSEGVKSVSPLRIYVHKSNVVIVQTIEKGKESGIYINLPLSSYRPKNGDDGFEFTPLDQYTYTFTRTSP